MEDLVLKIARDAIETYVRTGKRIPKPEKYPKEFDEKRGVFVTIYTKPKDLRGCIGFPYPSLPLIDGLISASIDACRDPRFPELAKDELNDIWIEVSVLSEPKPVTLKRQTDILGSIEPGKDGLIIQKGGCSALYLPQVWEELPDKEVFLSSLCLKAGLSRNEWLDSKARFFKFQVKSYAEM